MRRNPLLYSNQADYEQHDEEPVVNTPSRKGRSLLFYFVILINSLLVISVLGLIWFLFLKSPDFHLKDYIDKYLGNSDQSSAISTTQPSPATPAIETSQTEALTKQQQEEVQQARLKQMREQEALDAERQRLEALRAEIAAEREKAELAKQALQTQTTNDRDTDGTDMTSESASPIAQPEEQTTVTGVTTTPEKDPSPEPAENSALIDATEASDNNEPAVVRNAASETLGEPVNTMNNQVDQIMEVLRQQQEQNGSNESATDTP